MFGARVNISSIEPPAIEVPARPPRLPAFCIFLAVLAITTLPATLRANDPEGCLTCHQYRGLTRIAADGKNVELFYVNPDYWDKSMGAHARLRCTDCHDRKEVEVFPHHPVTPVDCAKTCHLAAPGTMEVRFSHQRIDHVLGASIHGSAALETSNHLLGNPLRAGQSQCLLCHDEPVFRASDLNPLSAQASMDRCDSCHDQELPRDARWSYWHVHSHSKPARLNLDLARVCATCHSNAKVREQFKLPDATASYLVSFHGKAALLGSQETANCLDCHATAVQSVHGMLAHDATGAPTGTAQLSDTCRNPACHASAGRNISTAAIHLDLATSHGVEYFIGCIFVVLIVFTFGPSLLITALKMFHGVIGRQDPAEHENLRRLDRLRALPSASKQLQRFTLHQRLQHWYLVICFVTLVVTGFPIKFAGHEWAAWTIRQLGGLPMARLFHRWAGALLLLGLFYHLGYVIFTLRAERQKKGIIRAVLGLPMMVNPLDMKQMGQLMGYLLGIRSRHPEMGRFNAEEKFEYIGVFWGTIVLGATGVLMWFNATSSRFLPGRLLTIAVIIHSFEAFLALLHVGVVHMVGVTLGPKVFPVSPAMFTGQTPAHELAEAHGAMLADLEQKQRLPAATGGVSHA